MSCSVLQIKHSICHKVTAMIWFSKIPKRFSFVEMSNPLHSKRKVTKKWLQINYNSQWPPKFKVFLHKSRAQDVDEWEIQDNHYDPALRKSAPAKDHVLSQIVPERWNRWHVIREVKAIPKQHSNSNEELEVQDTPCWTWAWCLCSQAATALCVQGEGQRGLSFPIEEQLLAEKRLIW